MLVIFESKRYKYTYIYMKMMVLKLYLLLLFATQTLSQTQKNAVLAVRVSRIRTGTHRDLLSAI